MATFRAACVQVNAGNDMDANLAAAGDLIRRAADAGADFITTPEVVAMMEAGRDNIRAKAADEPNHPALAAFRSLAAETGKWLLVGSLTIKEDDGPLYNRSFLLDPEGRIVARYDKIHMFDVNLANGASYRESNAYRSGGAAVLADLPWARLGMTICYDLRFPYLYRDLAHAGAQVLTIPSAFTRTTGEAHWHVLLRARAIETGCFVIAAAQCGSHPGNRHTYGHSLMIAPWGEIIAEAGTAPGVIAADIDTALVDTARGRVPSLEHDREYGAPAVVNMVADAAE